MKLADASPKLSANPVAACASQRIDGKSKLIVKKLYQNRSANVQTWALFYAGCALRGGLALGARGWTRAATNSLSLRPDPFCFVTTIA
jgi:hypothetical protein